MTECPLLANKECKLNKINGMKSYRKLLSMKQETDDELSNCSNFPESPTNTELASNKPVLLEIEHLRQNIS